MAGKKQNMGPMWKFLQKDTERRRFDAIQEIKRT